jgi:hypothetical protein
MSRRPFCAAWSGFWMPTKKPFPLLRSVYRWRQRGRGERRGKRSKNLFCTGFGYLPKVEREIEREPVLRSVVRIFGHNELIFCNIFFIYLLVVFFAH